MRWPAGNAPVMIHRSLLEQIVEDWYDISLRMKNDPDANRAFGWILEMVRPLLLHPFTAAQPPLWGRMLACFLTPGGSPR